MAPAQAPGYPPYGQPAYPQGPYGQPMYPQAMPQGYPQGYAPQAMAGVPAPQGPPYGYPQGYPPVAAPMAPPPPPAQQSESPFFFVGEFDLLIDDKNRLLFPSEIRKEINPERDGDSLVIYTGPNGHYWIYPELYYRKVVAQHRPKPLPTPTEIRYGLRLHSRMGRMSPDKQGRALLPDKVVNRQKLGREVTLVGNYDHLQLWRREDWHTFINAEEDRAPELAAEMAALKPG